MIKTYYSELYGAEADVISMSKLPLIAEEVENKGWGMLFKPHLYRKNTEPIDIIGALLRLHSPEYVDAFIAGREPLASSNGFKWSRRIRDAVLASNTGMIAGARDALQEGVTANIGQGYHHAKWGRGDAFCTFNGLALVAQEMSDKKVFVLDADEHQGDGTKEFTARLENLYNFSIFGTRMSDGDLLAGRAWDRKVCGWDEYESALWDGLMKIEEIQPDLVIYQAGVDCYKNDGMSQARLRSSELISRDVIVFDFLRNAGIPVLFVMAGGYGEMAVHHHVQTFAVATGIYG